MSVNRLWHSWQDILWIYTFRSHWVVIMLEIRVFGKRFFVVNLILKRYFSNYIMDVTLSVALCLLILKVLDWLFERFRFYVYFTYIYLFDYYLFLQCITPMVSTAVSVRHFSILMRRARAGDCFRNTTAVLRQCYGRTTEVLRRYYGGIAQKQQQQQPADLRQRGQERGQAQYR